MILLTPDSTPISTPASSRRTTQEFTGNPNVRSGYHAGMDTQPNSHLEDLVNELNLTAEFDAPIGPLTYYQVGGNADVMVDPDSVEQLAELVRRCHQQSIPVHILGRGANLLVADSGVRGVVVRLKSPFFRRIEISRQTGTAIAGGGTDLARLIMSCARQGVAGLECLAGIPATVGGALRMNAGGKYGDIAKTVHSVTCMDGSGRIETLYPDDLSFSYRDSNLADRFVLEARFALEEDDPAEVRARVKDIFNYKTNTQPLAARTAGCTFKNPSKEQPAGMLIDQAGLKGTRIGGAEISTHHANFIVAAPNGSADDVLKLIKLAQDRVKDMHGIDMHREVVVWGDLPGDTNHG